MIFQNDFGSSKEVASSRESELKPFLEKPEPCQRGPKTKWKKCAKKNIQAGKVYGLL
jgi:hypothetical protein